MQTFHQLYELREQQRQLEVLIKMENDFHNNFNYNNPKHINLCQSSLPQSMVSSTQLQLKRY